MLIHQRGPNKVCESPPLPPGFRFHPTDEELVSCYLTHRVLDSNVIFQAIGEVDFNKCEPWDLPAKAKVGHQNVFYFFSLRDRKYPTGLRTNRATEAGYWKATGKDREVIAKSSGRKLGMKKTLVFYKGRAPKGEKTNWIMHEYRLESEFKPNQQEWVVCRAFEKNVSSKRTPPESYNAGCNGEYSRDIPCSFEPPLPDLKSFDSGYNGEYSTDLPSPFEPDLPDLKSFNAGYYGEYSTDLLCPFEPALPDLKSFSSNSLKPNAPSEPQGTPQGWFQDATFSGQEKILRRSNSSMKVKRELGDTLENLVSGWDMGSPVPIWDVNVEHQLIPWQS